jgi:hypothetical protein
MKQSLVLAVMLIAGVLIGYKLREVSIHKARAVQPFTFNDHLDDGTFAYLSAYGSCRSADLANKVNTVRILCDPSTKRCDTTQADVIYLTNRPMMMLDTSSFAITRLDKNMLHAEARPNECIRVILIFDRLAKQVSLVRTKVGSGETCSIVQDEPVTLSLGDPWRE